MWYLNQARNALTNSEPKKFKLVTQSEKEGVTYALFVIWTACFMDQKLKWLSITSADMLNALKLQSEVNRWFAFIRNGKMVNFFIATPSVFPTAKSRQSYSKSVQSYGKIGQLLLVPIFIRIFNYGRKHLQLLIYVMGLTQP